MLDDIIKSGSIEAVIVCVASVIVTSRHLSSTACCTNVLLAVILTLLISSILNTDINIITLCIWSIAYTFVGNIWCLHWAYNHRLPSMISLLALLLSLIFRTLATLCSSPSIGYSITSWIYSLLQRLIVLLLISDVWPMMATHPVLRSLSPRTSASSSSTASVVSVDGGFLDELFRDLNVLRMSLRSRAPFVSRIFSIAASWVITLQSITQRPFVRQWYCRPLAVCTWGVAITLLLILMSSLWRSSIDENGMNDNTGYGSDNVSVMFIQLLCLTLGTAMSDLLRNEKWSKNVYSTTSTPLPAHPQVIPLRSSFITHAH